MVTWETNFENRAGQERKDGVVHIIENSVLSRAWKVELHPHDPCGERRESTLEGCLMTTHNTHIHIYTICTHTYTLNAYIF